MGQQSASLCGAARSVDQSKPGSCSCCDALQVGQVSTPTANVAQALQKTTETNKIDDVVLLLYEEMQQAETNGHRMPLTIVFVERKLRADKVAEALRAETISAAALHGGLSQVLT